MKFAERMFLLQYGAERVVHSLSIRDGTPRLYWEPFVGVLVYSGDRWILFDTGLAQDAVADAGVHASYRETALERGADELEQWRLSPAPPAAGTWLWTRPGDPLLSALGDVGVSVGDLDCAVVSHFHLDHSGGIRTLADAGVSVLVGERDLQVTLGEPVAGSAVHRPDWRDARTDWRPLSGDVEIAPGVTLLATPGHTPGHTSLMVRLPESGTWIFAADAADLAQNLHEGRCCGSTFPDDQFETAQESLDRLLDLAASEDARLIPGHDQVVFNAAKHPLRGHR